MKKRLRRAISLSLLLLLAACGNQTTAAPEMTIQELIDAHRLESMLENYESVRIQCEANGEPYTDMYLSEEVSYEDFGTWEQYMSDQSCYIYENGAYRRIVWLEADGFVDIADFRAETYDTPMLNTDSLKEDIQSITSKNGRLIVTTELDREKLTKEELADLVDDTLVSGNFEYVLDANTYDPIQATGSQTYEDGLTIEADFTFTYDTEISEALQKFLDLEQQTEDLRTVTLVFHAKDGTEQTEYIQLPRGMMIGLCTPSYTVDEFELYADAACTELFVDSGSYMEDTTVHVKWIG